MYPRLYNQQGQYQVSNDTVLIAEVLNSTNTGLFLLDWGIPFLTMNYIIGDYANSQFLMAPAIRTDFQNQGGGYELQAICEALPTSTSSSTTSATHSSTAAAGGGSLTPSSPAAVEPSDHNSDKGAIVGGAVGGVLGFLLIVGGLGLLFYRTRRRGGGSAPRAPEVAERGATPAPVSAGGAPSDRLSRVTATSRTEAGMNELSSDGKRDTSSVNHWLSGHDASETSMSANVDRPFEMPTSRYDSE